MSLRDGFFFLSGIGFLGLAKAKNIIHGYSSPKPFDISEVERCINYDIKVVGDWLSRLQEYSLSNSFHVGKRVLELGPGSDLGVGVCLLAKGCSQYNALDVNDLVKSVPNSFYDKLLERLRDDDISIRVDYLRNQLEELRAGNPSQLNFVARRDFNLLAVFEVSSIDLVFSQAAFEHFDDIAETIGQLTAVCRPGAILIAEIDLRTHSRWIRDKDPNNIYRYPDSLYKKFWFRGIPNRLRPYQYREAFERCGWENVVIEPLTRLNKNSSASSGMSKRFRDPRSHMDYLSIILCATRTG